MKKFIITFVLLILITSCQNPNDKERKGDFTYRKCAKCGSEKN